MAAAATPRERASGEPSLALPATEHAVRGAARRRALVRLAPNDWALAIADGAALPSGAAAALADHDGGAGAAELLGALRPVSGPLRVVVARLELDECGLWATLACAGAALPIVVRRAGWIDVRGQSAAPWTAGADPAAVGEDRVGLGPGDALVVVSSAVADARDGDGERFGDEALLTALVGTVGPVAAPPGPGRAGSAADGIADAVLDGLRRHGDVPAPDVPAPDVPAPDVAVTVLRVPEDATDDPPGRLRAALGVTGDEPLPLPGYRVGEPYWSPQRRPDPPRHARIVLPPDPAASPAARRFVVGVLHSWRLSELVTHDAVDVELVTSELVGNAIRHGGSPFSVLVGGDGARVRVAVGDGSRALPSPREATLDDDSGRGLALVEALADGTGITPTVDGKRVWAEFSVPPPASAG